jgi:hypothetical protein
MENVWVIEILDPLPTSQSFLSFVKLKVAEHDKAEGRVKIQRVY